MNKLLPATACALLIAANAYGIPLTWTNPLGYDTPGIVGTIGGKNGDNQSDEAVFAQTLLNVVGLGVTYNDGTRNYLTSTIQDYSGTIVGPEYKGGAGVASVPTGYEYAIAKYDGKQAGYVLFYLGGQDATLPQYPYDFWTTGTEQYALSHFTAFDPVAVADGGTTAILMGIGMLGVGFLARRKA